MRISDWSSDVCSSDLQASKLSQLWGLIPGDHLDQRAFSHIEQRHVSRAVSDGLSNGVRELRRVGENDLLLGLEVVEQGAAREKGGRSEEHTSELQSLMRISYAVFCLKKKNKRTPMYNNNKTTL